MEPWRSKLAGGDTQAAWDLFVERYRPLLLATIRRVVHDPDDVMDVFSVVCQSLADNGLARLRRFSDQHARGASFSTWLVVVVRNLGIDWLRERDGRQRLSVPANLSTLQKQIYTAVFLEGLSHVEAFELIQTRTGSTQSFHQFLQEVRATYRVAPHRPGESQRRPLPASYGDQVARPAGDPAETAESARRIAKALGTLPPEVRLAVELFVVEHLSAAAVAVAVGWPNAKAVYNRVYRALDTLRAELAREGIGPGDL